MISEAASHFRCVPSIRTYFRGSGDVGRKDYPFGDLSAPCCSRPAKNCRGSTRCAASCGHAYTQLGSANSEQRSQDVAFCLTIAFFFPGDPGTSAKTSNGCIFMFPYGQLSAQRPQPMHQSSMITSREFRQ